MVFITDFIRPICLTPEVFVLEDFEGYQPLVAGWGKTWNDENNRMYYANI